VKFDDQLAQYLYENKFLKLQGIGTFTLDNKVSIPSGQEKEIYYPIEGLAFTYNPKEVLDETLVTFLVKRLGKIQPLVRSDLDSYLSNIKQFLNLGKPYTIEGVGTLNKNNQGTYEFTPGNFLPAKEELNPKRENADHNYPASSSNRAGKILAVILIILASLAALGGIGWGISTLLSKRSAENTEQQQEPIDSTAQHESGNNTITAPKDTATTVRPPVATAITPTSPTDTVRYKMIFEITPNIARAVKRTQQLVTVYHLHARYDTIGSGAALRYRMYLPARIRPADTLHYKDSLYRYFGRKIYVDKL
jgi:hypothetical protein